MKITWTIKYFSDLTTDELYKIIHLRIAVFSVEQNCVYQDLDWKDQKSFHVMGTDEQRELHAYSRIFPAGAYFKEAAIGRVITSQKARRTGLGKTLMITSMNFVKEKYGDVPVRIGAQCYLINFYSQFGFVVDSEEYLEDNIPHVEMLKQ